MFSSRIVVTAIRVMELDLTPDNVKVHEALLQQMLQILEKEHNEFIMKELLDVNKEPQKSYMSEFEGKVSRALKRHRTRLQLPPVPNQPPDRGPQQEISAFRLMEEEMNDGLTSVSQAGSAASRMSKGPALLHKLKSQQSKIKAKATAISNVIGHSDIMSNPKLF